ncbi:MAG: NUDIX domain-containing protein [Candidatus Thorarchaeota archaeon]
MNKIVADKMDFIEMTLCIIFCKCGRRDKILLGKKAKGLGKGYWNGFGGKIKPGESIKEANTREVFEETGIELYEDDTFLMGLNRFIFPENKTILEVHVFVAHIRELINPKLNAEFDGFEWFDKGQLPYENMWSDDRYWVPYLFEEKFSKDFILWIAATI